MLRSFMIALMFACLVINFVLLIMNLLHANPMAIVNFIGLICSIYSFSYWLMYAD